MTESNYIVDDSRKLKEIFSNRKLEKPSLIISSPPYFDLLNYENNKKQIGFGEKDYQKYLEEVANIFQDCYSLSKRNASFWLIVNSFKKNGEVVTLPFDIHTTLKRKFEKTWVLKEVIIWDKEKNLPWAAKGRFRHLYEYILFFSKGEKFTFNLDSVREIHDLKKWWKTYPERYSPNGRAPANVWRFITPIRGWGHDKQPHLCPFPFPLVEKIISISSKPGDTILDPFAGSGTVLAISSLMGRKSIGIDVNSKYEKLFIKNVVPGSQQYWNRRKKEIGSNLSLFKRYSETNKKLRILKVGSHIKRDLDTQKISYHTFILANGSSKFNVCLVADKKIKIKLSEETRNLIEQAAVLPKIIFYKKENFKLKYGKAKFYKYDVTKFYSYISKEKLNGFADNIIAGNGHIFSNINLKINS